MNVPLRIAPRRSGNSGDAGGGGGPGGLMLIVGFLLAIALVSWLFVEWQERREQRLLRPEILSSLEGGDVTRLTGSRRGHYIATGTINGQPVRFLVDTGASSVAMPASVAKRLGLRGGRDVRSTTASGVTTGRSATLDSVTLGNIALRDVTGVILPDMPGDDVLLGMSFLSRVDFSQSGNSLLLRRRDTP